MKIYQIHEYGGSWEDAYDYIVGSYLSKDKAIAEKDRLEEEEEKRRKCGLCPLFNCSGCEYDCEECNNSERVERTKAYCSRYEPFDNDKHDPEEYDFKKCVNYYYGDNSYFRINEVEVIE